MTAPRKLVATLSAPPGLNASYRSSPAGWYMTSRARNWKEGAILDLRRAGWLTLPEGFYWIQVYVVLHTISLDVDAPVKILIDTAIGEALGVNDRQVGAMAVVKVPVRHRREERLKISAEIRRLESKEEFAEASRNAWI